MPKPNYNFEKRQRELAKKKKQEEKRERKMSRTPSDTAADGEAGPAVNGPPAAATDGEQPA